MANNHYQCIGNIYSVIFKNNEDMFPLYYMHMDVKINNCPILYPHAKLNKKPKSNLFIFSDIF